MNAESASRMGTDERREQILAAATVVFGERGYTGATTDAIAQQAGVSQAYVVRLFGSKEALFVAAGGRAVERIEAAFQEVIDGFDGTETELERRAAAGVAYSNLIADRGLLLTLQNFMQQGSDDTCGPLARARYLGIYRMIRDGIGLTPAATVEFMARGMLINTLMALRMPDIADEDPDALELLGCTFDGKEQQVIALAHLYPRLDSHARS